MSEFKLQYQPSLTLKVWHGPPQRRSLQHVIVMLMVGSAIELTGLTAIAQGSPHQTDAIKEIPEEVLETEIILDARSPINGEPLTPAEYAQLQDELHVPRGEVPGRLSPKIHRALVLLRLRKVIGTLFPFLF